jgi:hypothetical protein
MTENVQRRALNICSRIAEKLSGARVKWKYQGGRYHSIVADGKPRFSIQFTGAFLLRKSQRDLEVELHRLVERIRCETGKRSIRRTG